MKRLLLVLLALLLSVGCQARYGPPGDAGADRSFILGLRARTAQVQMHCESGNGTGSGVWLGQHRDGGAVMATAGHVADPECDLEIDGHEAIVLARDEEADWAILLVPGGPLFPSLEMADVYLGMPVVTVGYPYQLYDSTAHEQVSRGELVVIFEKRYRVDSPLWFGSSGGPVFDAEGHLVGLAQSVLTLGGVLPVADQFFLTPGHLVINAFRELEQ